MQQMQDHPVSPESEGDPTEECGWERVRSGLSAEPRGLNTDCFSFIFKPSYLSQLLGFLFLTQNPLKPEADLTQEGCSFVASAWPNMEGSLGKHPIN